MSADDPHVERRTPEHDGDLDAYLSDVLRRTLGGEVVGSETPATVLLPDKEDLTIRLVSQHSLERLRDAESDRAVYDNLLWCLIGGVLGFLTNVLTGDRRIDITGSLFLAFILAISVAVLVMRTRLSRRLKEARSRVHVGQDRNSGGD